MKEIDLSTRQHPSHKASGPAPFSNRSVAVNQITGTSATILQANKNTALSVAYVMAQVQSAVTVQLLKDGVPISAAYALQANSAIRFAGTYLPNNSVLTLSLSASATVSTEAPYFIGERPDAIVGETEIFFLSGASAPSGSVSAYAGAAAPSGWLLCDGSAVSRTAFAALFAAIGTAFGAGDGSTTFNLPDLQGRAAVGAGTGAGLSPRVLAQQGGEETHLLINGEIPSHTHPSPAVHDPTHTHAHVWSAGNAPIFKGLAAVSGSGLFISQNPTDFTISNAATGITLDANTGADGGGAAHNNMQPFTVLNFIIKT